MAKLLDIGRDQRIRLLTISHSLSGFGAVYGLCVCVCVCVCLLPHAHAYGFLSGMHGVKVSLFAKDSYSPSDSWLSYVDWR